MNEDTKRNSISLVEGGLAEIVQNYTKNALLINACFVSSQRYEEMTQDIRLSTIQNIPKPLRLDTEIDRQYTKNQLVNEYKSDVLDVVLKNYVVVSISIVDAILEDIYECFLRDFEVDISDSDVEKKVRSAWANDNILKYFQSENKANLKKPEGMEMPYHESFMRYKELRIVRHSLVHTNGIVSKRNLDSLRRYKENTCITRRKYALIDSPILESGNKIFLSVQIVLSIRQYLHNFLMYQLKSIENA